MKGLLYLLCGVVGGVAGALVIDATRDKAPTRTVRETPRENNAELRAEIDALRAKIEAIQLAAVVDPPAARDTDAPPNETTAQPREAVPPGADPFAVDEQGIPKYAAGVAKYVLEAKEFGPTEANRMFGWMARNPKQIKAVIAKLEAEVQRDPENADLHAALATAYVGELSNNTQPGPQQGRVWAQASRAYDAAIKLEPEHWQARFGKAIGTTFIPVQFGMRPAAIKQFEDLRKIQESQAPKAHHATTYTQLSQLYAEAGNAEKARAVLDDGLRLFPDDAQIKAQLEVLEKR